MSRWFPCKLTSVTLAAHQIHCPRACMILLDGHRYKSMPCLVKLCASCPTPPNLCIFLSTQCRTHLKRHWPIRIHRHALARRVVLVFLHRHSLARIMPTALCSFFYIDIHSLTSCLPRCAHFFTSTFARSHRARMGNAALEPCIFVYPSERHRNL